MDRSSIEALGYWIQNKFAFLNDVADWWNIQVRIRITRFISKYLSLGNKDKTIWRKMLSLITSGVFMYVILKLMTLYSKPLVEVNARFGNIGFGWKVALLAIMLVIFEEETRFLRKICQTLDERSNIKPYGSKTLYVFPKADRTKRTLMQNIPAALIFGGLSALSMEIGTRFDASHVANTSSNVEALNILAKAYPLHLLVVTWVMAPVIEELVFRGIIFRVFLGLGDGYSDEKSKTKTIIITVIAMILQGVVFALMHRPNTWGYAVALTVSGMVFSCTVLYTGRVKWAVMSHVVANMLPALIFTATL